MKLEHIKRLVQSYLDTALEQCEAARLHARPDEDEDEALSLALTGALEETQGQLAMNDFRKISQEADELLSTRKLTLSKDSEAYRRLCRELLKAKQVVLKAEIQRWDGNYWHPDSAEYSPRPSANSVGGHRSETPEEMRLFAEALRDYFKHYEHRDQRTNSEKNVIFTRFAETIGGGDRPLQDIAKAECVRFRDMYSRLPKRIANDLRGKPMSEVLKAVEGTDYLAVTKRTVNLALDDVRHFFSWAIKHDLFAGKNPVDGIAYEGVKKKSYELFSDEDLRKIFCSSEFIAQRNGKYPERFWLPLILLHTGARREEVAALRTADVKQQDGAWFFDITTDEAEGKRLKNLASKRRVPIHSYLINLGFFEYLDRRKAEGSVLLFPPSAKVKGRPTPGDAVGKWFHRLRLEHGVAGRKPLHSFRHTVITRLAGAGVPQDIREILVGHASDTVHGQTYTHREAIPIRLLQTHLEKMTFDLWSGSDRPR
jgi:integrase